MNPQRENTSTREDEAGLRTPAQLLAQHSKARLMLFFLAGSNQPYPLAVDLQRAPKARLTPAEKAGICLSFSSQCSSFIFEKFLMSSPRRNSF